MGIRTGNPEWQPGAAGATPIRHTNLQAIEDAIDQSAPLDDDGKIPLEFFPDDIPTSGGGTGGPDSGTGILRATGVPQTVWWGIFSANNQPVPPNDGKLHYGFRLS